MTRRILVSYLLMTLLILAMLTVPLGLTFAARERDRLFTAIERDGYIHNILDDEDLGETDRQSGRISLAVKPNTAEPLCAGFAGRTAMVGQGAVMSTTNV